MKARVIVFALSLLGVVGCADKPHRSRKAKAEEPVLKNRQHPAHKAHVRRALSYLRGAGGRFALGRDEKIES
ncbi:MAG: hypothetical protein L6V35_00685 [Alistipes putredinis]|nr:MAG: hypothetical protein L6V35_00685 [Alistipes putredinis]